MDSRFLNKRVRIEEFKNIAEVGDAETKEWTFIKWSWANIAFKSGGSAFTEEGQNVFTRVLITMRYDSAINYNCRIKYDNQYYSIHHIEDVDRKKMMRITSVNWEEAIDE